MDEVKFEPSYPLWFAAEKTVDGYKYPKGVAKQGKATIDLFLMFTTEGLAAEFIKEYSGRLDLLAFGVKDENQLFELTQALEPMEIYHVFVKTESGQYTVPIEQIRKRHGKDRV